MDERQRVKLLRELSPDFEASLETRHLFFRALSQLEHPGAVTLERFDDLGEKLTYLKDNGIYTYARVAVQIMNELLQHGRIGLQREIFADSYHVLFVSPHRTYRYNPQLLGSARTVSFLEFMGIESYLFDMSLAKHREILKQRIVDSPDRIAFVSMCDLGNPLASSDYESIFQVWGLLRSLTDTNRRFIAGGSGASHSHEELLALTPIEIIFQKYGSVAFAEMIFDTEYSGPRDNRGNWELFGRVPNLIIREGEKILYTKKAQFWNLDDPVGIAPLKVVRWTLDPTKVDYRAYWGNVPMDICAPYAFNPPSKLGFSTGKRDVHPDDLYLQLKMVREVTATGNCQRRCRHCQYTVFTPHLYFHSPMDFIEMIDRTLAILPEAEVIGLNDDEFLSARVRENQLESLLAALRGHRSYGSVIYAMETVPQAVQDEAVLELLKEAGFRAIVLGVENHVEDAVRHDRKLKMDDDYQAFINAAKRTHDAGFYTKTSFMVFYPTIGEEQLPTTLYGLLDYIDYGISVILFPFVIPKKGTGFAPKYADFDDFGIKGWDYQLPNGNIVSVDQIVLPQDKALRGFAEDAVISTQDELRQMRVQYGFGDVYPAQLEALAFIGSVIRKWRDYSNRGVDDKVMDDLSMRVENSIQRIANRSKIQLSVRDAVIAGSPKMVEELESSLAVFALRRYIDFGHEQEIINAARIYQALAIKDKNMLDSLRLRTHHSNPAVSAACNDAIMRYS